MRPDAFGSPQLITVFPRVGDSGAAILPDMSNLHESRALVCGILLFAVALHSAGQSDTKAAGGQGTAPTEIRELAQSLEAAIIRFHEAKGRYPWSLEEVGSVPALPPSVQSVRLGGTGYTKIIPAVIALELALPDLGGRRLYFLQRTDRGPSSWECVSTDIASITRLMPECAYAPGYVAPDIKVQPLERPWVAVYTGTVGGSPVVALLWQVRQTTSTARDPAVPVEGLYYYRSHALTLALRQAADRRGLAECPESFNGEDACPRPTGLWRVDVTEDRVTGTWRASSDAPSKVVKLTRHAIKKPSDDAAHDLYYDMQHEDRREAVASEARRHGIVWKTERRGSGTRALTGRIVLLESPDPTARGRINQRLKASIGYPDSSAECEKHFESCDDGNDIDVTFANERLLAVAGSVYWSGGAHPSNGFGATTYDLASGQEVNWWRIVRVTDAPAGKEHPIDLHRTDLLASYVLRAAMEDPDGCMPAVAQYYGCAGDSCASGPDADDITWVFYPTLEGLAVAPQVYSEAARGCRTESVVVPWTDVRKTVLGDRVVP
jgi:hypothetical protein